MVAQLRVVARSTFFTRFILSVILTAGALVGIQSYPSNIEAYGSILHILDTAILWIFVAEAAIKILAEGSQPQRYFKDPWNVFDFTIVVVCFLPLDASFVAVLRLARVLRVLKLVNALPELQLIVNALLRSIPSMGYVSLLLGILFYIYACLAVTLYGANDPHHFANLELSLLSLFRVVTLEDWTDLMYIAMYGCANYGYDGMMDKCVASTASPLGGAVFFVSFVLLGTMIVLNLFIGVIMNGMDEAKKEQELHKADQDKGPQFALINAARDIQNQLEKLQQDADIIRYHAEKLRDDDHEKPRSA